MPFINAPLSYTNLNDEKNSFFYIILINTKQQVFKRDTLQMQKLEALIEYVTSCDRLVPRGTDWFELYLLGVNYLQIQSDADFPKPLKWDSPLKKKRDRLIKQIELAVKSRLF